MSYQVECDECSEKVDIRGYSGHLRMAHGINGEEMRQMVEKAKAYVPPSRRSGADSSEARDSSEGVAHASQVRQTAQQGAQSDRAGGLAACTMCGRNADVQRAEDVARLFEQKGYRVPDELHEYEFYCADCEYAFNGGAD